MAVTVSITGHGERGSRLLRITEGIGWLLDRVAMMIATSSVVLIFLALMADVIVRYITHSSLGWPSEVPNLLFPWLIMGGIVMGAYRGAHIAAEAIRGLLSTERLRLLLIAIHLTVACAFAYLAYLSVGVIAITAGQKLPLTGIGQSWPYASMLFGFGGIALASILNAIRTAYAVDPNALNMPETVEHTL